MVTRYGISIIGGGRLGRSLGRGLRERGWKVHSVVTRSRATAKRAVRAIGGGSPRYSISGQELVPPVILIAVPDSAIPEVAEELAAAQWPQKAKRVVLHTSGAWPSGILAPLRQFGASVGSVHPLQSFSGIGSPNLEGCIFAVEGDSGATRVARSIARALDGRILPLDPAAKPLYHAAATMAAGQVLAELEAAIQIFASLGMKRREALRALLPLTRQVLENLERLGPRPAWTGPLARGDFSVIEAHENSLGSWPGEYLTAYRALNRLSARLLSRNPESAQAELDRISLGTNHPWQAKGANA
jgi:predicted short-subunit dehydrogenase-like oxidoreductase (DUF2520 family)